MHLALTCFDGHEFPSRRWHRRDIRRRTMPPMAEFACTIRVVESMNEMSATTSTSVADRVRMMRSKGTMKATRKRSSTLAADRVRMIGSKSAMIVGPR